MDKIKEFFGKTPVRIVLAVLFAVSSAGLLIGGVSVDSLVGIIKAIVAALASIAAVVAAVLAVISGKKNKKDAAKN